MYLNFIKHVHIYIYIYTHDILCVLFAGGTPVIAPIVLEDEGDEAVPPPPVPDAHHVGKKFTLGPMYAIKRHHAFLDIRVLYGICRRVPGLLGPRHIQSLPNFTSNKKIWFQKLFHFNVTPNQEFCFSISSDGVSCSISLKRPVADPPPIPINRMICHKRPVCELLEDEGVDANPLVWPPNNVLDRPIVGVDPGRTNPIYAVLELPWDPLVQRVRSKKFVMARDCYHKYSGNIYVFYSPISVSYIISLLQY
jgi:hypothetical protein